jgi:hypothetical protein
LKTFFLSSAHPTTILEGTGEVKLAQLHLPSDINCKTEISFEIENIQ